MYEIYFHVVGFLAIFNTCDVKYKVVIENPWPNRKCFPIAK